MTSWIITAVLALAIAWIIYTEMKCGRRSKSMLAKTNEDINTLRRNATVAYRARYGRDPTAPFALVDDDTPKVSSKGP
jgi:hypothetical protein